MLSQMQEDGTIHPITFASRMLQPHEKKIMEYWRWRDSEWFGPLSTSGITFTATTTVYTDHEALKALLNTLQLSGKLARWGMALQELHLQIKYRLGKTNTRADTLSRYPVSLLQDNIVQTGRRAAQTYSASDKGMIHN